MDKYEFNLKVEQMKKLIEEEDYVTAFKIAQSIDWRRVRNTNLLTMAASVFEKNNELQEAKDMLILAFERAPVGKHLLFKLTELSCKTKDLDEAEDYYREFRAIDSTDLNNYLLQYMILKARHAPYEKQILPLERYCENDPDEKWLYELASSYEYANRVEDCVRVCDRIALLYGDSTYSQKALRLKMRYAELTDVQKNILYPRSIPEEKIRYEEPQYEAVETEDERETVMQPAAFEVPANEPAPAPVTEEPEYDAESAAEDVYEEAEEAKAERNADMFRRSDELAAMKYDDEDAAFAAYVRKLNQLESGEPEEEPAAEEEPQGDGVQMAFDFTSGAPVVVVDTDEEAAAESEAAAAEPTEPAAELQPEEEIPAEQEIPEEEPKQAPAAEVVSKPAAPAVSAENNGFHMIIEAESVAEGLIIAVDELKNVHEDNKISHASIKTSAEKLNVKGISDAILDKVRGKDFVIENAGDLDRNNLKTIYRFIVGDTSDSIVVLIDTPAGLDRIEELCPELFDVCDYVSDIEEEEEAELPEEDEAYADEEEAYDEEDEYEDEDEAGDEPYEDEAYDEEDDDEPYEDDEEEEKETKSPVKRSNGKVSSERFYNVKEVTPSRPDHQMEIDEFAQYCAQYAAEIDCSITGTSMLALYERIELMEEDGIPLTKTNAEQLIEQAADRAEKPPIGKRITGMFRSKYDKNGLLILKEDDFIY